MRLTFTAQILLMTVAVVYGNLFAGTKKTEDVKRPKPVPLNDIKRPKPVPLNETEKLLQSFRTKADKIFTVGTANIDDGKAILDLIQKIAKKGSPAELAQTCPYLDKKLVRVNGPAVVVLKNFTESEKPCNDSKRVLAFLPISRKYLDVRKEQTTPKERHTFIQNFFSGLGFAAVNKPFQYQDVSPEGLFSATTNDKSDIVSNLANVVGTSVDVLSNFKNRSSADKAGAINNLVDGATDTISSLVSSLTKNNTNSTAGKLANTIGQTVKDGTQAYKDLAAAFSSNGTNSTKTKGDAVGNAVKTGADTIANLITGLGGAKNSTNGTNKVSDAVKTTGDVIGGLANLFSGLFNDKSKTDDKTKDKGEAQKNTNDTSGMNGVTTKPPVETTTKKDVGKEVANGFKNFFGGLFG